VKQSYAKCAGFSKPFFMPILLPVTGVTSCASLFLYLDSPFDSSRKKCRSCDDFGHLRWYNNGIGKPENGGNKYVKKITKMKYVHFRLSKEV